MIDEIKIREYNPTRKAWGIYVNDRIVYAAPTPEEARDIAGRRDVLAGYAAIYLDDTSISQRLITKNHCRVNVRWSEVDETFVRQMPWYKVEKVEPPMFKKGEN